MNYNFHTHTPMCGHASGSLESYIENAIEGGIKFMGFSDHLPFVKKDGTEDAFRVPYNRGKEYVTELSELREKYKDKIEIYIGFESEYYPENFDDMVKSAVDFGGEYLILGAHYLSETDLSHSITPTNSSEYLKRYVKNIEDAMKTGIFTYVAHPDIVNFIGDADAYCEQMRKLCKTSFECGVPLEINFLGIRENRNYPSELFWKVAGEEKSPVVFGCDAHSAESACDRESQKRAEEIVKKYSLNYIGKPDIIKLKQKI